MRTKLVSILAICILTFVVSCDLVGPSPNPSTIDLVITGNTDYGEDETASFQFTVPGAGSRGIIASSRSISGLIPVTGQIRAGDILFSLNGTYNTETGNFTISASGTIFGTKIDITIGGTYQTEGSQIQGGFTAVTITNSEGNIEFWESDRVESGESSSAPLSTVQTDTSVSVATPIPLENKKFWEGDWAMNQRLYHSITWVPSTEDNPGYYQYTGTSTSPTLYWTQTVATVKATPTQYWMNFSSKPNTALANIVSQGYLGGNISDWNYSLIQQSTLVEVIQETDTKLIGIFYVHNQGDPWFNKNSILITGQGGLWGYDWHAAGEGGGEIRGYSTQGAAKTNLTVEDSNNLGNLTRVQ
jgi:hypothetical protein